MPDAPPARIKWAVMLLLSHLAMTAGGTASAMNAAALSEDASQSWRMQEPVASSRPLSRETSCPSSTGKLHPCKALRNRCADDAAIPSSTPPGTDSFPDLAFGKMLAYTDVCT
jgi:hypothetical protein